MSQKLTLGDLKDESTRIAAALNVCPEDARLTAWANESEERMANQGRWWGSVQEVQFCVDETGCFTLPRQVATLEKIAINGRNIDLQNGWSPFTRPVAHVPQCKECSTGCGSQSGTRCGTCGALRMYERSGTAASYAVTLGDNKVIRSYPTDVADVGKKLVFQGYDRNGIWVKAEDANGQLIDGEEVVLGFPFVDTETVWNPGSPLAVKKEVTARRVLVYEYDTETGGLVDLAAYEAGETRPMYRVGYIPHIKRVGNCGCDSRSQGKRTLTALATLQHVPLISDGDWMMFQNVGAYKAAMMAVKAWEEGDVAKGDYYFYGRQSAPSNVRGPLRVVNRGGAIPLLKAELLKMTGGMVNAFVRMDETTRPVANMMLFW
jgi:hypothetical protein